MVSHIMVQVDTYSIHSKYNKQLRWITILNVHPTYIKTSSAIMDNCVEKDVFLHFFDQLLQFISVLNSVLEKSTC